MSNQGQGRFAFLLQALVVIAIVIVLAIAIFFDLTQSAVRPRLLGANHHTRKPIKLKLKALLSRDGSTLTYSFSARGLSSPIVSAVISTGTTDKDITSAIVGTGVNDDEAVGNGVWLRIPSRSQKLRVRLTTSDSKTIEFDSQ